MRVIVATKSDDVPLQPIDNKLTYVYWNIVGLAHPARLALTYVNADAVDVRIDAGDKTAPDFRSAWMESKPKLQKVMNFPNLPYLMDGDIMLSQSDAILRYIGRKFNLMGVPGHEHTVDVALCQLKDAETVLGRLFYGTDRDVTVAWFKTHVPHMMETWSDFLTSNKKYLTGDQVSIADFKLYTLLYKLKVTQADLDIAEMGDFMGGNLDAFYKRIESLDKVQEYLTRPECLLRPLNNPSAWFR